MKSLFKLIFVLIVFTTTFFILRFYGDSVGYNVSILVLNLGGLAYLYSTVGTIFAIFAAFVIVSESQDWVVLNAASKNEVSDLNELWLWSQKLSKQTAARFSIAIQRYLEAIIEVEWNALKEGRQSPEMSRIISTFHDLIADSLEENPNITPQMFALLNNLLCHRAIRIEYSWEPLPTILKFTVFLVDICVVGLSLLIGVQNLWLDYIFMVCIVTLGTVVLIVIDDLDNPLRSGEWCLTSDNHARLLDNIRHYRKK